MELADAAWEQTKEQSCSAKSLRRETLVHSFVTPSGDERNRSLRQLISKATRLSPGWLYDGTGETKHCLEPQLS
jgi:hypothetical protein